MENEKTLSRAGLLQKLAVAPIAIGAFAMLKAQEAEAKTAQTAVQYVSHPNGAKKCSGCKFYQANKDAKANGACQIVAGSISPNGYCVAYAPK